MLLSDGYLANGSEPWRIPDVDDLPQIDPDFATEPNHDRRRQGRRGRVLALPARRGDPRPAVGDPRHRRASSTASAAWRRATGTATSPTTPPTTTSWSAPAQAKVDRIAESLPPLEVDDPTGAGARCWCSAGARRTARSAPPSAGSATPACDVAQAHLRHLNPFPQRPRRDPQALRRGDGPRDEPRPALACCSGRSTSSTSSATTTSAACRCKAAELAEAITDLIGATEPSTSSSTVETTTRRLVR